MDHSAHDFSIQIRGCARELARVGVSALGELYDLTATRLLRYTIVITRNREDAEDAISSAMLRIAARPKALAGARHPWPYFIRVARNEALKIVQKRKNVQAINVVSEPADDSWRPELEDSRRYVRQALAKLPQSQSEVIALKIWENLTFAEIAEVLKLSPNTVASRYRYGMQKLTEHLQVLHR